MDPSCKGGVVVCFIKSSMAYNYNDCFYINTVNIFVQIYFPKSKPVLLGILYRQAQADESDFVKH